MSKYSFSYRNGLTLFFLALFVVTLVAQVIFGWKDNNNEIINRGGSPILLSAYLHSGHFISATFENFQSEFLQMGMYVLLTVGLRQIGSAESKSLDEAEDVDKEPKPSKNAPWAVNKGGLWVKIYSNSLSIAFLILFLISWALHLYGSWIEHNDEQTLLHQPADSLATYLTDPSFWFQTFQNWQSEFLSIVAIVFLSIYLRQKGSPESKPIDAPHMKTGK
ncbi:DUF6766 family protein [Mucilaginibacter antarcticus]|uniref:DUF6766 family protein n=1 Tax=Mucilaginibacter antarcticus TaxID=1855725 RepID=A0ABW5XMB9_9SPHI